MTLFAALTATSYDDDGDGADAAAGRGPPSSSPSSPPEVIQLHSNLYIDFLVGTVVDLAKKKGAHAYAYASGNDGGGVGVVVEAGDHRPTAAEDDERRRPFSALSYQAVQTRREGGGDEHDDDDDGGGNNAAGGPPGPKAAGRRRRRWTRGHPRPDLGVWDCRVDGADLGIMLNAWGQQGGCEPDATYPCLDLGNLAGAVAAK